jgi:hypothetical protein
VTAEEDVKEPSGSGLRAEGTEGAGRGGREERSGSICEVKRGTERLLAHGSFRRTGDAGSRTAAGGHRMACSGRPATNPEPSRTAWASRRVDLRRIASRDRSRPRSHDASRARPSAGQDRTNMAQLRTEVKNKERTFFRCPRAVIPGLMRAAASAVARHPRPWAGDPRLWKRCGSKTGMAATSAAMTGRGGGRRAAAARAETLRRRHPRL